ncbi:40776_t:CDS:2 [Gigaspora margarita]|uniref:40776_t:CDS:1 n=1 Tax=Gigaspora margarita TaxID=4874 RepID=A0ABN7W4Z6_GIGMA|nr:40776_t:CDS:2 [Gigaspora margarita]
MFKKIRFEDIYFQTYYPLLTVAHLPNNEIIVGAENDMFENHINNFFEYAVKKTRASHIIDESRTLLDPDMVTTLMYQRNWLEVSEKFG